MIDATAKVSAKVLTSAKVSYVHPRASVTRLANVTTKLEPVQIHFQTRTQNATTAIPSQVLHFVPLTAVPLVNFLTGYFR